MQSRTKAPTQASRNGMNGQAPKMGKKGQVTIPAVDYTSTIERAKAYFLADDAKRLADNPKYQANRAPTENRLALSFKAWLHATGAAKATKEVKADYAAFQTWVAKRLPVGPGGQPLMLVRESLAEKDPVLGIPTVKRQTYRTDIKLSNSERAGLIRELIAKAEAELAKAAE